MKQNSIDQARKISKQLKPSRPWDKLRFEACRPSKDGPVEDFYNNIYGVTLRKFETGWALNGGPWAQIGIYSLDGKPRHDWRDFQKIKNDLLGEEWEAIELYPAESRLMDPSNYYILFCAPSIPIGMFQKRVVVNEEKCIAPQRPWHPAAQPSDVNAIVT